MDDMSAEATTCDPSTDFDVSGTGSTVAIGALRCSLSVRSFSGLDKKDIQARRHHFASVREVEHANRLAVHGSFDGERYIARKLSRQDSFFLPMGRRWAGKSRG